MRNHLPPDRFRLQLHPLLHPLRIEPAPPAPINRQSMPLAGQIADASCVGRVFFAFFSPVRPSSRPTPKRRLSAHRLIEWGAVSARRAYRRRRAAGLCLVSGARLTGRRGRHDASHDRSPFAEFHDGPIPGPSHLCVECRTRSLGPQSSRFFPARPPIHVNCERFQFSKVRASSVSAAVSLFFFVSQTQ